MIVLDVGNTAVTAARSLGFGGSGPQDVASFRHALPDFGPALFAWIAARAASDAEPVAIASVNAAALACVLDALGPNRRALLAPRDFAPSVVNECRPPEAVGLDRLFNAEACDEHRDSIVVDAGTAITVDLVAKGRVFKGGAIAPGVRLGLDSLHRGTGQLPRVEPSPSPPALGTSTDAAIRSGVIVGAAGAIDRLVHDLSPPECDVWITGGDAALLLPLLRSRPRHDPTLTLRGIARAAARALAASP